MTIEFICFSICLSIFLPIFLSIHLTFNLSLSFSFYLYSFVLLSITLLPSPSLFIFPFLLRYLKIVMQKGGNKYSFSKVSQQTLSSRQLLSLPSFLADKTIVSHVFAFFKIWITLVPAEVGSKRCSKIDIRYSYMQNQKELYILPSYCFFPANYCHSNRNH